MLQNKTWAGTTPDLSLNSSFFAFKMLSDRDERDMHAKEQFIISHAALCTIPLALTAGDDAVPSAETDTHGEQFPYSDTDTCCRPEVPMLNRCRTLPGTLIDSRGENDPIKSEFPDIHEVEGSKHEFDHHAHRLFDSDDDLDYPAHHHWHPHDSSSHYS